MPAQAGQSDDDWLNDFINRLAPGSEAAAILINLGPGASEKQKIAALARCFRDKPPVRPLWVISMPMNKDPNYDTELADKAVNNFITSMYGEDQFGNLLPWFGKDKKVRTLARFPHFDYLVPAYFHTGNEDYARTIVRHMVDFVDHAPIHLAENVNPQTDYIVNPWNWVLQHWRILRWIDALAFLRHSPSLADSTYLKIIHHIWQEVDWLAPRMILGLHNGTLGNVRGVLYAGLNFPDADNGEYWLAEAGNTFRSFIEFYFYPGEVSVELTLGYSSAVLGHCLKIYESLPAGNLKKSIGNALERIVDGHLGLMKPDHSLPRYGDHGNYDLRVDVLAPAARLFNRQDLQGLTGEGPSTSTPDFLSFPTQSNPYYLSGYYAMRDGWGEDSQYLSMDAGPFGTNHQHADKLSITVSADGGEFIIDPGTSIYNSTDPGPRYDLRRGYLHNTITINDIDQNAGWDQHYQFDVLDNRWVTNEQYDFLEGSYDFRSNGLDIIHRRTILYRRGDYWLLLDALKGKGRVGVESNFQYQFGNEVKVEAGQVVAKSPSGAVLDMVSAEDGLEPGITMGDTIPAPTQFPLRYANIDHIAGGRGWVGTFGNHTRHDPNQSHPAPAVVFTGLVELPHYSVRVLSPSKNKKANSVAVAWLEKRPERLSLKIDHLGTNQGIQDIFTWKPNNVYGPASTRPNHESGFWLRQINGLIAEIIFMNSREVKFEGTESRVTLVFSSPAEGFMLRRKNGWHLYVDSYMEENLEIRSFVMSDKGSKPMTYKREGRSDFILLDEAGQQVAGIPPGARGELILR